MYGADAVGGVVNFILKDNFEGASVRPASRDTQHGGEQEIVDLGPLGVKLGQQPRQRDVRHRLCIARRKWTMWQRDWRVADMANPATNGRRFRVLADKTLGHQRAPCHGFGPELRRPDAFNAGNNPSQAAVDAIFR